MTQRDEIQKAVNLASEGKRTQARAVLLSLEPFIIDARTKLEFIDVAISILSPVEDNSKILGLLLEGIKITAASGLKDLYAFFLSRLADSTMLVVGNKHYRMKMLKMAPRWIEFATEADKKEYESLFVEVKKLESGIDDTLTDAVSLSEKSGNKKIQGMVFMAKGSVEGARYLQRKSGYFLNSYRAKLWNKFEFMRYPFFEYILLYSNGDSRKLNAYVRAFTKSFLKAAGLFVEMNDLRASNAYYNLANDLRTTYRFKSAKKYLAKAKEIATHHNDAQMLRQINKMEKSIDAKNRDIPDYLNGEGRDFDSL